MQYSEGRLGRVFALRLEHGDKLPDLLVAFAADKGISAGVAFMVGGVDDGSKLVVGPENGDVMPPVPMVSALCGAHEAAAVGMIFPGADGQPTVHMHAACGRGENTTTGCIRHGIITWQVLEVVLIEICDLDVARLPDAATGFTLMQCGENARSGE